MDKQSMVGLFIYFFNIKSYTEYKQTHKKIKTNQIMKYIEKK